MQVHVLHPSSRLLARSAHPARCLPGTCDRHDVPATTARNGCFRAECICTSHTATPTLLEQGKTDSWDRDPSRHRPDRLQSPSAPRERKNSTARVHQRRVPGFECEPSTSVSSSADLVTDDKVWQSVIAPTSSSNDIDDAFHFGQIEGRLDNGNASPANSVSRIGDVLHGDTTVRSCSPMQPLDLDGWSQRGHGQTSLSKCMR